MNWRTFGVYLVVVGVLGVAGGLIWASVLGSRFDECEMMNSLRDIQGALNGVELEADQCRGPGIGQAVAAAGGVLVLLGIGVAVAGRDA